VHSNKIVEVCKMHVVVTRDANHCVSIRRDSMVLELVGSGGLEFAIGFFFRTACKPKICFDCAIDEFARCEPSTRDCFLLIRDSMKP
jgi:hypothetical protein